MPWKSHQSIDLNQAAQELLSLTVLPTHTRFDESWYKKFIGNLKTIIQLAVELFVTQLLNEF